MGKGNKPNKDSKKGMKKPGEFRKNKKVKVIASDTGTISFPAAS